jgi:hypothetical protein
MRAYGAIIFTVIYCIIALVASGKFRLHIAKRVPRQTDPSRAPAMTRSMASAVMRQCGRYRGVGLGLPRGSAV